MLSWPEREDWKQASYLNANFDRYKESLQQGWKMPQIDVDFIVEQVTLMLFSRMVSSIWDWDILVEDVLLSKNAALQLHRDMRANKLTGERHSLEALVWEGWQVPSIWFRAGTDETPHSWLGCIPVEATLDDSLTEYGLSMLAKAQHPAQHPAYVRGLELNAPLDPDAALLERILEDKASQS